ncbi:MAG: sigma-70 family RNA polymerase sigma factor [Bryobacteraceae bacterium]
MVSTHTGEFSRLFDQYHGLVFRTAYRITGNAADAEDVLQTIFLRLVRRDPSSQRLENEESYLRRAAVNASVDLIRARQAEARAPLREVGFETPSGEVQECLRQALGRLSPRSAEVFALRFLEDFTNQQIAKSLNISQVLVAVTLHRARRQLQKEIRSCLGGRL